jgi:hypothetical protein
VVRLSAVIAARLCIATLGALGAYVTTAFGVPPLGHDVGSPVYQRRAFEWSDGKDKRHDDKLRHSTYWRSPQVNAGWFQRPYPYHLDYYRMRYGGSYAPYFGNLYGPPQVVTAPPYYGPYYGGYGYQAEGMYGSPLQSPLNGALETQPQTNNGTLPAPRP